MIAFFTLAFFDCSTLFFINDFLMSDFKAFNSRQKTSFLREIMENADLRKPVLNKLMTRQE